jgi:hypothetical protein
VSSLSIACENFRLAGVFIAEVVAATSLLVEPSRTPRSLHDETRTSEDSVAIEHCIGEALKRLAELLTHNVASAGEGMTVDLK